MGQKIALLDSQLSIPGSRANQELVSPLPALIRSAVLPLGMESEITQFCMQRNDKVGLIVAHVSGIIARNASEVDERLGALVKTYNHSRMEQMGEAGGVPIVVVSGDTAELARLRAKSYVCWHRRQEWPNEASLAGSPGRLIERVRNLYSSTIDRLDAHLVLRTLIAIQARIADSTRTVSGGGESGVLTPKDCYRRVRRLTDSEVVLGYAEKLFDMTGGYYGDALMVINSINMDLPLSPNLPPEFADTVDALAGSLNHVIQRKESA